MCMRIILLIFLCLESLAAFGQGLQIRHFRSIPDGAASDLRTPVTDPDGDPCAVLKIETGLEGLTFDAGLAGIMDVRHGANAIYLYIPRSARALTIAHKEYGALRNWAFPVSLEAGRIYAMSLSYEKPSKASAPAPKPTPTPAPAPKPTPAPRTETSRPMQTRLPDYGFDSSPGGEFCSHFIDFYAGFRPGGDDDAFGVNWVGLSYTLIGEKIGPYISMGLEMDDTFSFLGGAAYRLTKPEVSNLDWQLYGGIGLFDGDLGVEIGTRFAWKSSTTSVSLWDFGIGCQFYSGHIVPTVSVGLCIWGIPTLIGLGIVTYCVAGM